MNITLDFSAFLPGNRTILLLPSMVVAVRGVRLLGQTKVQTLGTWPHHGGESLHQSLLAAKAELGLGKETLCHVGVRLDDMMLVDFRLPVAAKDDLKNAVRYALMRHVPYDLGDVEWDYEVRELHNEYDVCVALIHKPVLSRIMELFSSAGIPVATLFPATLLLASLAGGGGVLAMAAGGSQDVLIWDGRRICWQETFAENIVDISRKACAMLESFGIERRRIVLLGAESFAVPEGVVLDCVDFRALDYATLPHFRINVVAEEAIRAQRQSRIFLVGASVVLLCMLLALPFRDLVIWERRLDVLEERVNALKSEADNLVDIRQKNAAFEKRMERWAKLLGSNINMSQILREITEVFPAGAWLDSLQVQERKAILSGSGPSATYILEQLENSPLFEDVHLDAPITKQGQMEVFRIVATITVQ